MVLLDALYINTGGAKVLLDLLVESLEKSGHSVYYLLDQRIENAYPEIPQDRKIFLAPSLLKRHRFYKEHRKDFSSVLCFGNLPPSVKLNVPVHTYFQNVLYFEMSDKYDWKLRFGFFLKRLILKYLSKNTDEFWVQSEKVRKLVIHNLNGFEHKVWLAPFFRKPDLNAIPKKEKPLNFMYLSDGHPHKNVELLLDAWEILFEKGKTPELHLTITSFYPKLIQRINSMKKKGINVINHGFVDPKMLFDQCRYQLYPSIRESFGLGMVESIMWNTDIITTDLPYVYEVIKPHSTFNPNNRLEVVEIVDKILSNNNDDDEPTMKAQLIVEDKMGQMIERLS